jgi:hypothetical protein
MMSIKKFCIIVVIVVASSFSLSANTDNYWVKCDSINKEYAIFKEYNKVNLESKADTSKTKSTKKIEKVSNNIDKEDNLKAANEFVDNLLKLSMTLLGIIFILLILGALSMVVVVIFDLLYWLKKR